MLCALQALSRQDLERILDRMLQSLYSRLLIAGMPIIMHYSSAVRRCLLAKGYDPQFGARLRRVLENHLVAPLSRLIASEQIRPGMVIAVGVRKGSLTFKVEEGRLKRALVI